MPAEQQRQRHDADADLLRAGALGVARSRDPPSARHHGAGRVADRREVHLRRLLDHRAELLGQAAVVHLLAAGAVRPLQGHGDDI